MAPHPAPTPAPQATYGGNPISYASVTPLTTMWQPPSSCLQPTPTLFAGTCILGTCSPWNEDEFSTLAYAENNLVYWTTTGQVSTKCAAPSSQQVHGFYYSPAVGCPLDFTTVSAIQLYGGDVSAICCPSSYAIHAILSSDIYLCQRYARTSEVMVAAAFGTLPLLDENGYSTDQYGELSTIGTTTLTSIPSGGLYVVTRAIRMVVPSALVTGATSMDPTATDLSPPTSSATTTKSGSGMPNYHIANLSFPISIVITAACAIAFIILLCLAGRIFKGMNRVFAWLKRCMFPEYPPCGHPWLRCDRRRKGKCCLCSKPPMRSYSLVDGSLSDFCLSCQTSWYTSNGRKDFPPGCSHKSLHGCSASPSTVCCACRDTNHEKIPLDRRVANYCVQCRIAWKSDDRRQFPAAWTPFPTCSHPPVSQCHTAKVGKCCACQDRNLSKLSLRHRVTNYCPHCSGYWTNSPPPIFPASWLPFPCMHKQWCSSGTNDPQCCQCKDDRPGGLSIRGRTRPYCSPCRGSVESVYSSGSLHQLPARWHPFAEECIHISKGCSKTDSGICCICREQRNRRTEDLCKNCVEQHSWRVHFIKQDRKFKADSTPLPPGIADLGPQREPPLLMRSEDVRRWKFTSVPARPQTTVLAPLSPLSGKDGTSTGRENANSSLAALIGQQHLQGKKPPKPTKLPSSSKKKPPPSREPVTTTSNERRSRAARGPTLASLEDFHSLEKKTMTV